jgi:ABC-type sulfate/molybdate transport systems ATPase subunit
VRDLVLAREAAADDLRRKRQQLLSRCGDRHMADRRRSSLKVPDRRRVALAPGNVTIPYRALDAYTAVRLRQWLDGSYAALQYSRNLSSVSLVERRGFKLMVIVA